MKSAVEQRLDFEFSRLDAYLLKVFGSTGGEGEPLEISRTQGGMSNPTYFLRRGSWQAVLRKQPAGVVLPSAHAID